MKSNLKLNKQTKIYARLRKKKYLQKSVRERIEALFLDNIGKIVTREQIIQVAIDPVTGKQPENWHQRLSELRTDHGYTILSWRNRGWLRVEEYLMPTAMKRRAAGKRIKPTSVTWMKVLERAKYSCEWTEGSKKCNLKEGDVDLVGGGLVKLTADHKKPHSIKPDSDPHNPSQWQALCGRHQIIKKNYWDTDSGKMNVYAIIQSSTLNEKKIIFKFLLDFFGYVIEKNQKITKIVK